MPTGNQPALFYVVGVAENHRGRQYNYCPPYFAGWGGVEMQDEPREVEGTKSKSGWLDFLEAVVIALALAMVIRAFLFEPFVIPSRSMEQILEPGDRIIVSKLSYRVAEPERGDVIVFRYPPEPRLVYIKRVIGLPGETLEFRDGVLYVNNRPVGEPYLDGQVYTHDYGPVSVPAGSFFVMGDNRNLSEDSRVWGTVPEENILGKAVVLFWPPDRISLIK